MALRFSGKGRVRLFWDDAKEQWRCVVSDGERRAVVWVGRAPADRLAVDSPEAYDETAHAAISFACDAGCAADDEREPLDAEAFASSIDGCEAWHIGRSPEHAWPIESKYTAGDRVEVHPATDWWMRGARYGTIVRVIFNKDRTVRYRVRLDKAPPSNAEHRFTEANILQKV